eukprot:2278241-Heterocapsa_arctica.AAC.1
MEGFDPAKSLLPFGGPNGAKLLARRSSDDEEHGAWFNSGEDGVEAGATLAEQVPDVAAGAFEEGASFGLPSGPVLFDRSGKIVADFRKPAAG